jgi:hypothetical protein
MTHLATSIDGMFRRKRGRPPKNRVIEVSNIHLQPLVVAFERWFENFDYMNII